MCGDWHRHESDPRDVAAQIILGAMIVGAVLIGSMCSPGPRKHDVDGALDGDPIGRAPQSAPFDTRPDLPRARRHPHEHPRSPSAPWSGAVTAPAGCDAPIVGVSARAAHDQDQCLLRHAHQRGPQHKRRKGENERPRT